jgi:hypothetical protein
MTVVQPLLMPVRTQMAVEYLGQTQPVAQADDQRNVVYSFVFKVEDSCHALKYIRYSCFWLPTSRES